MIASRGANQSEAWNLAELGKNGVAGTLYNAKPPNTSYLSQSFSALFHTSMIQT